MRNNFLTKAEEKSFGCARCPHHRSMIERLVQDIHYKGERVPLYHPLDCPKEKGTCRYNAYASSKFLKLDGKFGKTFRERIEWLKEFCTEFQKSSKFEHEKIIDTFFQRIVNEIDFRCGVEDGVESFFFALNWDGTMKNGESFLEFAYQVILGKAYIHEVYQKIV